MLHDFLAYRKPTVLHTQEPVPAGPRLLPGMKTKAKKAISDLHPHLSWEHRAVLDYIHRHTPTKEELLAASGDPKYTTEGRLRELKKFGFVRGEQAIKEGGGRGRFGPVTYYVTDLALGIVPAGTEVKE